MRKVFLDNLPRTYKGVDWKNCIGYKINFIYDNIEGEVEIIDYQKIQCIVLSYNDKLYKIKTGEFVKCQLGRILGKITNEFKVEIGTIFKDNKRNITIVDREYRERKRNNRTPETEKWYKYKCNNCPNEDWIIEHSLLNNKAGCNVCCSISQKVITGYNDIPTTASWMVKFFQNGVEDARNYTRSSSQKIYPICPDCGRVKKKCMRINTIYYSKSIGCNCGDGISYPNKFMFNLLEQLKVSFEIEYSPEWISPKRFDFYIPSKNLIIEMDGGWHEQDNIISGQTKEESKEIDNWKSQQAKSKGIKVIRIDCNYEHTNRFTFVKNNILSSDLVDYYNLNDINWSESDKNATNNKIKQVCEFYEIHKNDMLIKNICEYFKITNTSIINYLKKGDKFGWCEYSGAGKRVICIEENIIFKSVAECVKEMNKKYNKNINTGGISAVCRGKQKSHRGFMFKYI